MKKLIKTILREYTEFFEDEMGDEMSIEPSYAPAKCPNCNCWESYGRSNYWNGDNSLFNSSIGTNTKVPKITISSSESNFTIDYKGIGSGFLLKHGKCGSGDTMHQLLNVLTYEINIFLAGKKLKPVLNNISMSKNGDYFKVSVPLIASENGKSYKLERRGGWGHDPGPSSVKNVYGSRTGFEGPVKKTGGGITEYFVTFES